MHTHSDNSPDGNHSMTLMCEFAVSQGLRALAITDHCECNQYRGHKYDRSIRQSYFEAVKARSVFSGRLIVAAGIELGQPLQDMDACREALAANHYDFVLCSLHNVTGVPDFGNFDPSLKETDYEENIRARYRTPGNPYRECVKKYYDELARMIDRVDFDSLAHFTYPLRYICGVAGMPLDMAEIREQTDDCLFRLAKRERALEINTSGLRWPQGWNCTMPGFDLIKRFKDLGGKYVTVGSDAHYFNHIGTGIQEGMELAKNAGFDEVTLFLKRQPVGIRIA
jgi:histidinol-phosphatase (PHP family)